MHHSLLQVMLSRIVVFYSPVLASNAPSHGGTGARGSAASHRCRLSRGAPVVGAGPLEPGAMGRSGSRRRRWSGHRSRGATGHERSGSSELARTCRGPGHDSSSSHGPEGSQGGCKATRCAFVLDAFPATCTAGVLETHKPRSFI